MKVCKQAAKLGFNLISVQKVGKVFLLFCSDSIHVWGNEKDVDKFISKREVLGEQV